MRLWYHKCMVRQEGGRVLQKQRTRATLLTTAAELMNDGRTPTVPEVAEAAGISRATAYRYFPSQELMLAEAALDAALPDITALLRGTGDGQEDIYRRLDLLIHEVQAWVAEHDVMFRALLRLSMDPALDEISARRQGASIPGRRGGRRKAWITEALDPVRRQLPADQFRMLVAALALFTGFETQVVLRDVCNLSEEEADAVARWGAAMLLRGALQETAAQE